MPIDEQVTLDHVSIADVALSFPQAIDVLVQDMLSWGMLRSLACYAHIVVLGRLESELTDRQVAF